MNLEWILEKSKHYVGISYNYLLKFCLRSKLFYHRDIFLLNFQLEKKINLIWNFVVLQISMNMDKSQNLQSFSKSGFGEVSKHIETE